MAFLKIDRAIADWKYWGNIYAMGIWFYVLHGANWADRYYRGVEVKRGQYLTSYRRLAEELNLDRRTIKHWLETFQKEGQIEITMLHKKTLITVINYDKYQTQNDEYVPQYAPQYVPQDVPQTVPHNVPHPNRRRIKEEKNNKNNISIIDKSLNIIDEQFNEFWSEYPHKVAKESAKKSFIKKCTNEETFRDIMNGLNIQKKYVWVDREERYIPHPTTWLNQERWKDEVNPNRSTQKSKTIYELLREELNNEQNGNNANTSDEIINVQFTESSD